MGTEKVRTNAMRMLDVAGLDFRTAEYDVDEEDLSGSSVARKIGLSPDEVFKTLVLRSDSGDVLVACVPVSAELDLKALAVFSGCRSVAMLAVKDLFPLTGYVRGGCSPIGMKRHYPVFFDETALLHDRIAVSAGIRGCQLVLSPSDLIGFLHAEVCDISRF